MLVKPDFGDVKDQVSPGVYRVKVVDAKIDKWVTDRGTTHYVNWEMETFDEKDQKNNGRKVWHKTPTNGKAAFLLQQFWKACIGEDINPKESNFDTEMLIGKAIEITVIDGVNRQSGAPTGYTEIKTVRTIQ